MPKRTKLALVGALIAFTTACTPLQVKAFFQAKGVDIDDATATVVAANLPWYARCAGQRGYVECLIRQRWAGTGHADRAVTIARRESGLNPRAKNRSSSASGVFQLTKVHWQGKFDPFDPIANIDYSYGLWQRSGWNCTCSWAQTAH